MKKKLERKNSRLYTEAERYVLKEIQKVCKRYKWVFKSTYSLTIFKNPDGLNNGDELYDTRLHKLIYWFEDEFGLFGHYVCDRGKWVEGSGFLIQFSKPNIK